MIEEQLIQCNSATSSKPGYGRQIIRVVDSVHYLVRMHCIVASKVLWVCSVTESTPV